MKRDQGFSLDLHICLAARDARAAENAAARARMAGDPQLVAALQSIAKRLGQKDVDWVEYFRNQGVNYP